MIAVPLARGIVPPPCSLPVSLHDLARGRGDRGTRSTRVLRGNTVSVWSATHDDAVADYMYRLAATADLHTHAFSARAKSVHIGGVWCGVVWCGKKLGLLAHRTILTGVAKRRLRLYATHNSYTRR